MALTLSSVFTDASLDQDSTKDIASVTYTITGTTGTGAAFSRTVTTTAAPANTDSGGTIGRTFSKLVYVPKGTYTITETAYTVDGQQCEPVAYTVRNTVDDTMDGSSRENYALNADTTVTFTNERKQLPVKVLMDWEPGLQSTEDPLAASGKALEYKISYENSKHGQTTLTDGDYKLTNAREEKNYTAIPTYSVFGTYTECKLDDSSMTGVLPDYNLNVVPGEQEISGVNTLVFTIEAHIKRGGIIIEKHFDEAFTFDEYKGATLTYTIERTDGQPIYGTGTTSVAMSITVPTDVRPEMLTGEVVLNGGDITNYYDGLDVKTKTAYTAEDTIFLPVIRATDGDVKYVLTESVSGGGTAAYFPSFTDQSGNPDDAFEQTNPPGQNVDSTFFGSANKAKFKLNPSGIIIGIDNANAPYICKIVEDFNGAKVEKPFRTLNAAVDYARRNIAMDAAHSATIEMLVDYTIPITDAVNLDQSTDNITITTAATSGGIYNFVDTQDGKADADKGKAILTRGYTGDSLFTVDNASASLAFNNIILDGDKTSKTHTTEGGGLVNVLAGTLSVSDGTVMRNSKSNTKGGAIYAHPNTTLNVGGSAKFVGCEADNGGAIFADEITSSITGSVQFDGCTANGCGGALYVQGGAVTVTDNVEFNDCKAGWDGSAYNGNGKGGAIDNGLGKGTLNISGNVSIHDCGGVWGGAINCEAGTTTNISGGTITGCSANSNGSAGRGLGAAVFLEDTTEDFGHRDGAILNMSGGTITGNIVSETVGAVEVGGIGARLNFSGEPTIYDNGISENVTDSQGNPVLEEDGSQKTRLRQKNIVLPYDTNAIINTTSDGLTGGKLGVYVGGAMNGDLMQKHGGPDRPFGTFASDANLDVFKNDRLSADPDAARLYGVVGTGTQIKWSGGIVFKIMDLNSRASISGAQIRLLNGGTQIWSGTADENGEIVLPWSVNDQNGAALGIRTEYRLEQTVTDSDHLVSTGYWLLNTDDEYRSFFQEFLTADHTTFGINRVDGKYELFNVGKGTFTVQKTWHADEETGDKRVGVAWNDDMVRDLTVKFRLYRVPAGAGVPYGSSVVDVPNELQLSSSAAVSDKWDWIDDTESYPDTNDYLNQHIQINVPGSADSNGFLKLSYPGIEGWYIVLNNINPTLAELRNGSAMHNRNMIRFSGRILAQNHVEHPDGGTNKGQIQLTEAAKTTYGDYILCGDIINFNGMLWIYMATDQGTARANTPGSGNDWYCLGRAAYASGTSGSLSISYDDQNTVIDIINRTDALHQLGSRALETMTSAKAEINGAEAVTVDADRNGVFALRAGTNEDHPWKVTFKDLPTGYVYFVMETEVDGDNIETKTSKSPYEWYNTKYEYAFDSSTHSGRVTIDNRIPDYIARVRNSSAVDTNGNVTAWNTWTYHRYLINDKPNGKSDNWEGAFKKANSLSDVVEIELLKHGPQDDGTDDTLVYGQEDTSRYTLGEGTTFSTQNFTLRTIQDDLWNPQPTVGERFKSVLKRGYNGASLFTLDNAATLTTENIIIDGAKGTYSGTDNNGTVNGGAISFSSGTLNLKSTTIRNSSADNGGAIYAGTSGTNAATVNMDDVDHPNTITGNTATGAGAGIYLAQGATLNLAGAPDFGGTDTDGSGAILGTNGNFLVTETGAGTLGTGKTNGGKEYTKARQDIFIEGYLGLTGTDPTPAVSLNVTDAITSGDGSIWVAAQIPAETESDVLKDNNHYKQLKQFATYTGSTAPSENTLKAFRNAETDETTENGTDTYLFGSLDGSMTVPDGSSYTGYIYWGGLEGYRKVILRSVTESDGVLTPNATRTFYIVKGEDTSVTTPYILTHRDNKTVKEQLGGTSAPDGVTLSPMTPGATGVFWIGELPYGKYVVRSTDGAVTYILTVGDDTPTTKNVTNQKVETTPGSRDGVTLKTQTTTP